MKKNILIVDNDENIVRFLSRELEAEGYFVCAVASGQEALSAVATGWPHLVIVDPNLNDLPCTELLERIRQQDAHLPIIICSGLAGLQHDYRFWPFHIKAFLSKPISIRKLKRELREALAGTEELAVATVSEQQGT